MFAYQRTVSVGEWFGKFSAVIMLTDGGLESGLMLDFPTPPTPEQIAAEAAAICDRLNVACADTELREMVRDNVLRFKYQTKAELADRFRAAFRSATSEDAAKMAYWIIERIVAGDFTDAQVRAAFGLTSAQYTATKARMQVLHDGWLAVQNAVGE